jgi:hypothetical protein
LFGVTRLSIEAGRDDPDLSAGLVSFLLDLLAEQLSTSRFWNIVILSIINLWTMPLVTITSRLNGIPYK